MRVGEPTISLIIPCFNAERYVGEAIASALDQSRPPDEIIVVDDGSGDDSSRVVRAFGASVRYVWQENRGIGAARNAGMAMAGGDILAFLDADDLWPKDSVATRLAVLMADPGLDFAYGRVAEFQNGGARYRELSLSGRLAGATLIHRRVFDRIGVFDPALRMGEMIDWVARAEAAGCRSARTEAVVLRRRMHDGNTMVRLKGARNEYLQVLRAAIERRRSPVGTAG
jgi:glycosyltransferase involved in cell wall biosynthesis